MPTPRSMSLSCLCLGGPSLCQTRYAEPQRQSAVGGPLMKMTTYIAALTLVRLGSLLPSCLRGSQHVTIAYTSRFVCVSSLRRGHANLVCTIPTLTDDP